MESSFQLCPRSRAPPRRAGERDASALWRHRGSATWIFRWDEDRGDAAAATWIFRWDEGRGDAAAATWSLAIERPGHQDCESRGAREDCESRGARTRASSRRASGGQVMSRAQRRVQTQETALQP